MIVSMNVSNFVKNLSGINNFTLTYQQFYTNLSAGVSLILGHVDLRVGSSKST